MTQKPGSESIDFLLAQICKLHFTRAHVLFEEIGLYRGQPPVLRMLWEREGRTHSELAAQLNVQPATITKMIQRMERAGFVARRPDPRDERVSRVYLTEAGRNVQADVQRIWRTLEAETFAGLKKEELGMLRQFFERIRDNLRQVNQEKSSC
ncbi:MAG: MarR family transcriptional regulator [Anaerolineae bacterium]|nr:MarR family transcriptional regulator [Anaerolineae bacterium]